MKRPIKRWLGVSRILVAIHFLIGSTLQTKQTKEYQGKVYPYVTLDISSASHPFYTGEQRQASNEGRVASFNKRFGRFNRKG